MKRIVAAMIAAACTLLPVPAADATEPASVLESPAESSTFIPDREFALFAAAYATHLAANASEYQELSRAELESELSDLLTVVTRADGSMAICLPLNICWNVPNPIEAVGDAIVAGIMFVADTTGLAEYGDTIAYCGGNTGCHAAAFAQLLVDAPKSSRTLIVNLAMAAGCQSGCDFIGDAGAIGWYVLGCAIAPTYCISQPPPQP